MIIQKVFELFIRIGLCRIEDHASKGSTVVRGAVAREGAKDRRVDPRIEPGQKGILELAV